MWIYFLKYLFLYLKYFQKIQYFVNFIQFSGSFQKTKKAKKSLKILQNLQCVGGHMAILLVTVCHQRFNVFFFWPQGGVEQKGVNKLRRTTHKKDLVIEYNLYLLSFWCHLLLLHLSSIKWSVSPKYNLDLYFRYLLSKVIYLHPYLFCMFNFKIYAKKGRNAKKGKNAKKGIWGVGIFYLVFIAHVILVCRIQYELLNCTFLLYQSPLYPVQYSAQAGLYQGRD